MRYTSLKVTNFTVFRDATFEFVPGANVLVGANGSGKTHILKILYYVQQTARPWAKPKTVLSSVFRVETNQALISSITLGDPTAVIEAAVDGGQIAVEIAQDGSETISGGLPVSESSSQPVFIPSVDMLAHTRRFGSTYDLYDIDFDQTFRDIVSLLLSPELRSVDDLGISLADLTGNLATKIEEEDERFYLTTNTGRFAAPLVAEGVRKLATLVQLIRNGFIRPGTTLFWDEPEASVSPSLLQNLVRAILHLTRSGVQIFLTTHSYELLKEFDLQGELGDVRYFALDAGSGYTAVHPSDTYDELAPNKIAAEFDSLLDRQLARSTGRSGKSANSR